ncbi:MAG: uroporphyrinogen decarboxylase family protein [Acidobacteriota bacterium]|nr:uroporphyrinogen decarboxylase family protein [Acidobacteriota bacterium]
MSNSIFQNALKRQLQATPPVWLMRQAGRYHSHYQQIRRQHSFSTMCKEPALAAETARGPVADFDFDAAILFSDLLFPLEALGIGLEYKDSGPCLAWPLDETSFDRLLDVEEAWPRLFFQAEAVRATRAVLPSDRSLIGFVGGPWTLFAYAVEGSHAGSMAQTKKMLPLFERFCDKLIPLLARSINAQQANGAEIVMILDTAAGELSPELFNAEIVPQLVRLVEACHSKPGYYSKGTQAAHLRAPLFTSGQLAGIGVDYRWDLREALALFTNGFVQGNFDPALLLLEQDELQRQLVRYLDRLRDVPRDGWICGLGHGVLPGTPENNVRMFVETVRRTMQ